MAAPSEHNGLDMSSSMPVAPSAPGGPKGPNQDTDEPQKGDAENSDIGNLCSELARNMTPEMLLEVLQIRDNWDIQQAALPQCTSNSRVTSELRLATIRLISLLFQDRFEKSWRQEDLDMAIEFMAKAVQLTPDNDPGKIASLGDLGTLHSERFERRGSLEDLCRAIELMEQAAFSTPFDHPSRPAMLNNLGVSYRLRCKRLGELADLEKSVHCNEQAVKLTPDGHPDKPGCLSNLGNSYRLRFVRLGRLADLDDSVHCKEQAVALTPDGHPDKPAYLNNLGVSYEQLFQRLGRLADLKKSVYCNEQAVKSTPDGHPDKPARLNNLGSSYELLFERLGRLADLEKSVHCNEKVVFLTPDGHPGRPGRFNRLGLSYLLRYERLGRLADLDKSIHCNEQAVMLTPDGDPGKPAPLNSLGNSYQLLFERLGRLADLDKSVHCNEQAAMLTPDGHRDKPRCLSSLGNSYELLFERLGRLADLDESVHCMEQAVMLTPDGHPDKPATLNNLGNSYQVRFEHLESLGDLEKSIDCHKRTLILTPDDHPAKYVYLMNLGDRFGRRFKRLGTFQDANQAADYLRQAVQLTPDGHPLQASQLVALGNLHSKMFTRSRLLQHGLEAMHFHRSASLVKAGKPSTRLQASHMWAILSCAVDPCSLEGYTHCMTLLPEVVWLGTSVTQRYERLMRDIGDLVTKAAAAAISQRRYDLAVEWLEQGRSIVWGQILQLRTPYDDLYAVHPELAQQLRYVSHQLECAPMLDPGDLVPGQDSLSSHKIAWMHRELAQRREALLASARLLPGLEGFLLPLNASKLMGTGQDRVVVMFNICGEKCDALVVQTATQDITHVPLTGFSTEKAEIARVELTGYLGARGSWRDDKQYDVQRRPVYPQHDPNWKDVLAMLWQDVVKPVLDHLGINQVVPVGNLPHITWCTTGSLSFLPLHAAGDYNSPDTILPNLAISSYTPTISSLCRQASSTGKFSGILAVGHGSPIRNLSSIPGTQAELDQVEMWAKPLPFVRLDEEQAYADTVLNEMGNHSWVHFACHASQNGMNPMKSAFHLHDKDLDLATIARTPLKNAQLAFLSACQTATGDAALPDESVHLAAGLLMAGYETVIATMWSINDGDAPLVAGKVYECLLEGGVPDSRKAAKALHKAVESLRDRIGVNEFARWVPYIHIGR